MPEYYYMNPFDFVPLPQNGPLEIPRDILNDSDRYEGYIDYSITTRTPVNIAGKIESEGIDNSLHYKQKSFFRYKPGGPCNIPGSSIRGMLASFIEALTGSDFGALTVGDEKSSDHNKPRKYAKDKWTRHAGFLVSSKGIEPHLDSSKFNYPKTLPGQFGQRSKSDVAGFLFGYVGQDEETVAQKGRLIFEDIVLEQSTPMRQQPAWDIRGTAAMGVPNPRANTAWYFTSKVPMVERSINRGSMLVWEVIPDQIRGRKIYFHQYPEGCFEHYRSIWKKPAAKQNSKNTKPNEGWVDLVEYQVEAIAPKIVLNGGRIHFSDLPLPLINLLKFALSLQNPLAHKLGGLKPFGFGSVTLKVENLQYRQQNDVFSIWRSLENDVTDSDLDERLIDRNAWKWLQKIMLFPGGSEKDHYMFIYPIFRPKPSRSWAEANNVNLSDYGPDKLGFAQLEQKYSPNPPKPKSTKKITMFFDHYQEKAKNFPKVFGNGFPYKHN